MSASPATVFLQTSRGRINLMYCSHSNDRSSSRTCVVEEIFE